MKVNYEHDNGDWKKQWHSSLPWFSCSVMWCPFNYCQLPSSEKSAFYFLSVFAAAACPNGSVIGHRGRPLPPVSHFPAQNCRARLLDCTRSNVGGEVEVEERLTQPVRPVRKKAQEKAAERAPWWLISARLHLQFANQTRCYHTRKASLLHCCPNLSTWQVFCYALIL